MTTQLLATELANLIQESKRKHNDLKQAAEKALEELKGIRPGNESQVADELAQRPNFVNPFIIACGTRNAKFTSIAIVCLQRLIVAGALPRSKLNQVLEALREATTSGLDVQLKILQALPSLLQNYAHDVKGDLLITSLNICFILQTSKNAIVNNTSAATLQQLVVSVFDKVVSEDRSGEVSVAGEVSAGDNTFQLGTAALDAYRVFNDLCLLTENQRPEYLRFAGLPQTFGLELIESVLTNHAAVFLSHPEQAYILRIRVMPFITSALKDKPNFATTVRLVRILYTLLRRHINILPSESGNALDILTQLLDHDTTLWKRSLCMEVFRGIFAEHALLRRIFMLYDAKEGEKDILKTLTATFVRLSTERPPVIGLGHQSTIPVSNPYGNPNAAADHAMIEAGGVTGIIGTSSVGTEGSTTGISAQWSTMRVPCIDQLDKTEPPNIPESYIYSLILSCISSFSEGIAKFILPLTVPAESRSRKRAAKQDSGRNSPAPTPPEGSPHPLNSRGRIERPRSASFKRNPVPRNPLNLEDHPLFAEIKTCASIVEECWPAILATCSTFLYAALDSEYYHGLVRAFQKFAHVAGLLQLAIPRDAFLTTLGKAAVPPNVFTACLNTGAPRAPSMDVSATTPGSIFSNAKGLLSVESLVNQASSAVERSRQSSFEVGTAALTTRNLLCLRALLNLGIALGPTLGPSWRIILETLQQADFVLYSTSKAPGRTPTVVRGQDPQAESEADALLANFGSETRAVETAASRLIESTVDFPNESFVQVVEATCDLLDRRHGDKALAEDKARANRPQSPPSGGGAGPSLKAPSPGRHGRRMNVSTAAAAGPNQEDQFALAKLGDIATINIGRLLAYPPEVSGWAALVSELIRTLGSSSINASVRLRAADVLVKLVLEFVNVATSLEEADQRGNVQLQALEALRDALIPLRRGDREETVATQTTDVDIHKAILEGLTTLLENCGESLVSGWPITFEIIDSIFKGPGGEPGEEDSRGTGGQSALATRSPKLVRSSFNSLRLICSDFLASLPNACFLILVDTLYKFCSQDDDLNMALTTVTFFWVLSDFLSGKNTSMRITSQMMGGSDAVALAKMASKGDDEASNAALWMLLLLRLTAVTADDRLELRNSAVQTLLRIFDAYGDNLDAEAWHTCVKHVIFLLLSSIEEELETSTRDETGDEERKAWYGTSVLVLNGISGLLASYLEILAKHPSFNSLWQELVGHFATLLDFDVLEINTATFKALDSILNHGEGDGKSDVVFDDGTVTAVWELWSRRIPVPQDSGGRPENADNQDCLIAYIGAFHDVYRLVEADLTVEHVDRMLTLFRETLQRATVAGAYVSDAERATPLQNQVMDAIKAIRTDLAGVPGVMISQVAELIRLPCYGEAAQAQQDASSSKRTFVAMSKASMEILRDLVLQNSADPDMYSRGAVSSALSALAQPITSKYGFAITVTRSAQPWRLATEVTLAVLEAVLPKLHTLDGIPRSTVQEIWDTTVLIADGIVSADTAATSAAANIANDESFDMGAFRTLRNLITPSLGAEVIPDRTRKSYAGSLFRTSIIHAPPPSEQDSLGSSHGGPGLAGLYKSRPGRTVDPAPTRRAKMAYVCLNELFALIAVQDEASDGSGAPGSPGDEGEDDTQQALHVRMARIAAPFVILRAGLTLRAFIADQPLRGRMPQPLSQRRELLHVLRALVDLRSRSEAIPDSPNVDSESRKHLLRLYPLLVQTVRVAGSADDGDVLAIGTEALGVVGGELGV
ncbi:hypothetical protein ACRALDRAFT_1039496 [Sodiomyces alcalophilus JCM 7366]|uniref:uncharacterized protein n=1 Tax=Sodiomyces alcalophilus JCM 7366 TaxID=591952 RepID=UPI0039B629C8